MKPDRWKQIEALFEEAVEQSPGERPGWLDAYCGEEGLRAEVEALLRAHERTGGILDRPLPGAPATASGSEEGRRVGPYRLVEEIGRGGMGVVYLAERADGHFEQQVAVKLLPPGRPTDDVVRRFRGERQILASLQHPNIARLYDGGVTDEGLPYLVMEYARGRPIDAYCETHALSFDERLTLFLTVVRAVQHAHQRLVIHRDLKPSNILVTDDGAPKLLDFGLAKLLREEPAEERPSTRPTRRWMTLQYASPEQVRGAPLTTASDTYQLGLILFELLTGQRPYDVTGKAPSEAERVICETEPARPSTAAATERFAPRQKLTGDLDTIILKALHKDPERGYASAEGLADDLERHRKGLPVSARPDTLGYRAKKFARRHRAGVAAAALVLLSLLAGMAGTVWQARRATGQARRAAAERDKAEQVTGFMMGLFEASDPREALGDTITARRLMARGVERAQQLDAQPDVQARMFSVIGRIYHDLSAYDRAVPLLERALDTLRARHGEDHPLVAEDLFYLADAVHHQGQFRRAGTLFEQAAAAYRLRPDTLTPEYAESLGVLASINNIRGRYAAAESLSREAIEVNRTLYGPDHAKTAFSMYRLAMARRARGDTAAARSLMRRVVSMQRAYYDGDHPDLAWTLGVLGNLLSADGDLDAAETLYRKALAMNRRLYGERHTNVATALLELGDLLREREAWDRAEARYREAQAIFRRVHGAAHPLTVAVKVALAEVQEARGNCEAAVPMLQQALAEFRETLPGGHPRIVHARRELGGCLLTLGRYEEAEPHLLAVYEAYRERGPKSERRALAHLVRFYDAWGKPDRAAVYRAHLDEARAAS